MLFQMDTFSMFYNEYPSSDATVTGIVTLLAVAESLGKIRVEIQTSEQAKDIMFTLFQGVSHFIYRTIRLLCY